MPKKKIKSTENKYREKEAAFLNRTPVFYRMSVVKVFRDYTDRLNGSGMSKPERIVQEFANVSGENINIAYDQYYEKIRNLRRGNDAVLKQEEFFLLVEAFVWKYCEADISGLNINMSLQIFGKAYCNLFSTTFDSDFSSATQAMTYTPFKQFVLNKNTFYKVLFSGAKLSKIFIDELLNRQEPIRDPCNTYFYIRESNSELFDYVFSFTNGSIENICYGIHNKITASFMLKQINTNSTVLCNYRKPEYKNENPELLVYPFITKDGINNTNSFDTNYRELLYDTTLTEVIDHTEKSGAEKRMYKVLKYLDFNFSS
ncbi:MAG: hypothetical protein KZQ89_02930 [Candidatus Thiodiazotropha sp. (ex Lucinoma kastoroae)]|nr:hypothetical protein [Candidatus Thiodiazotropha sp. (ex Lucinoma kastoroae)]